MTVVSGRLGMFGRPLIDIGPDRCAAILGTLHAGWKHASAAPNVHSAAGEVVITERLRDGMRAALKARNDRLLRGMLVLPGTESRSRPDAARPDGLTDIPIFFPRLHEQYDEHDPHAIIECKRVAGGNARLCRLYVTEGIDRFKTGQYAGNHAVGFMAGYLLSGDATSTTEGINRYLTGRKRQSERLGPCSVLDEPWARSSRHPRPAPAEPIALHHALLGLRPAPP